MKCLNILALLLTLTATSRALPLQKGMVPPEAKWLVHLDVDNFRDAKVGTLVINDVLAGPLAKLKSEFKVDGLLILRKLHSITAFGNDFKTGPRANGVLLLSGDEEMQTIVEGFLAAQILQNANGPIRKLQQDPFPLYSVNNELFISPRLAGQVVVSKSSQQIEAVREVLAHKAKGEANGAFSGYAKAPNSFFFLAVAEGFNENASLPPQAKILKMADGARIVLGEKAEHLFLNLALKAKDSEVIQQIGQVIEGMKAIIALGQSENKELLALVQSTKVSASEKIVTVNIEYPLSKVMGRLDGVSKHLQKTMESVHGHPVKAESDESTQSDPKQ